MEDVNITKIGRPSKRGEFLFECTNCGCEWDASRGDDGLSISPPCIEFYAYMKCPCCGKTIVDKDHKL